MLTTIIHRLDDFQGNRLYIKREDLIPFSFGGNKARKAELFFEEIDRGAYDCVVTYGSGSSNHCRIVANECCGRGIPCHIISPKEASEQTFNSQMMALFDAEITVVPVQSVHDTIENKLSELKVSGRKPYFIPGGGHGNLGTEAYVRCYEEIRQFESEQHIHFDDIFFASGTGTTQAGLICGKLMHRDEGQIIGISIARKNPRGRNVLLQSVRDYLTEHAFEIPENDIQSATIFLDDFTADGYGKDHPGITDTIHNVMCRYGVPLDRTYTGKAFYGMGQFLNMSNTHGKTVLFLHTGGTPLFFDELRRWDEKQ